jgi:hypothetical protein
MIPDYLTYEYIRDNNICGSLPYEPAIRAALDSGNVQFMNNGASSYAQCLFGAACYPCANSTHLQQNQTVMYATLAFGTCSVYRVEPQTTVYADLFINITTAGTLSQFMYLGSAQSSTTMGTMKLSRLSPTMRASIVLNTPDGLASQTADYIITCDGNQNSTLPAGVLGPFNKIFNRSGVVPSFQWADEIYPFLFSNETMNGGWIALSAADFENSFEQTTQDVFPCGKSQISPVSYGPTYAFYTSQSMVDEACAVDETSGAFNGTNAAIAQGRCVPGYFDSYGKTVCQRFSRMQNYSDTFIFAGYPQNYPPSEDLPQSYNIRNPQFFLFLQDDDEDNEATDIDGSGQLLLMQTAPSITDQIMVKGSVLIDVSTDSVPYVDNSSVSIRYAVPPQRGVLCRYENGVGRGYIQQTVCQLGGAFPLSSVLSIFNCDDDIVFLANETETGWSFDETGRIATYDEYVFTGPTDSCFNTSFIAFYVPNASLIFAGSNFTLFEPCDLKIVSKPTSDADDVNIVTMGTMACAAAPFGNRATSSTGNNPPIFGLWDFVLVIAVVIVVGILFVIIVVLAVVLTKKGKTVPQIQSESQPLYSK